MSTKKTKPSAAQEQIVKRLEALVRERSASVAAFDAYMKGTLTSADCSTLVDVVLRRLREEAKVGDRDLAMLDLVADAVAQLANRDEAR
jgi:hypothetical protein